MTSSSSVGARRVPGPRTVWRAPARAWRSSTAATRARSRAAAGSRAGRSSSSDGIDIRSCRTSGSPAPVECHGVRQAAFGSTPPAPPSLAVVSRRVFDGPCSRLRGRRAGLRRRVRAIARTPRLAPHHRRCPPRLRCARRRRRQQSGAAPRAQAVRPRGTVDRDRLLRPRRTSSDVAIDVSSTHRPATCGRSRGPITLPSAFPRASRRGHARAACIARGLADCRAVPRRGQLERYAWPIPSLTDAALARERPAGALSPDAARRRRRAGRSDHPRGHLFALQSGDSRRRACSGSDPPTPSRADPRRNPRRARAGRPVQGGSSGRLHGPARGALHRVRGSARS